MTRQLKQPLQLEACSTITKALCFCYGWVRSLTGPLVPLTGESVPLTGLFQCLIVSLGLGAFNCQDSGVSLRIQDPSSRNIFLPNIQLTKLLLSHNKNCFRNDFDLVTYVLHYIDCSQVPACTASFCCQVPD